MIIPLRWSKDKKKLSSPFLINSRLLCAQLGWPWPSGSLEKKISIKFCWCIFTTLYFVIISLWKKGALQLNKPESLSHKNTVPYLDEIGTLVLEKIFVNVLFLAIFFYSLWKMAAELFLWLNLIPIHPRMFCAKFSWNWTCGFGEEDFQMSSVYFQIPIISHWKMVWLSFENSWNPFLIGCFVQKLTCLRLSQ